MSIEQIDKQLKGYYQSLNKPYDELFSNYCDDYGIDDESLAMELEEDAEDSILVDFDDDFPFAKPPKNETDRRQKIFDLIKKCYSNPDLSFVVSMPEMGKDSSKSNTSTLFDNVFDNNDCKSVATCISIKRLIECLCFYNEHKNMIEQDCDVLLKYLNAHKYVQDDFHHILMHHLSGRTQTRHNFYSCKENTKQMNNTYWTIHNMVNKQVKCKLNSCKSIIRNYRDREQQPLYICITNPQQQIYIDTMDEIHNFFLHSYDCGMRIKLNELILETEQTYDVSLKCIIDHQLKNIQQIIKPKRKQLKKISAAFASRSLQNHLIFKTDENDAIYYIPSVLLIYGFVRIMSQNNDFYIPKDVILIIMEYHHIMHMHTNYCNDNVDDDDDDDIFFNVPSKYDKQYYVGERLQYFYEQ
eukprot:553874_1